MQRVKSTRRNMIGNKLLRLPAEMQYLLNGSREYRWHRIKCNGLSVRAAIELINRKGTVTVKSLGLCLSTLLIKDTGHYW